MPRRARVTSVLRSACAPIESLEARRLLTSVVATTPTNGLQKVSTAADITVRFDTAMLASSINPTTLNLTDGAGKAVPAAVKYDAATKTATIDPTAELATSAAYYHVTVADGSAGVRDTAGGTLTGGAYTFSFTTATPAFTEQTAFTGLIGPTDFRFADDGRIFVAEKRGVVKEFDSLSDTTATIVADLRTEVHNFFDRGLLGLAIDPKFTTGRPYIYVLYTYDGDIGGPSPKYGTPDTDSDAGDSNGNGTVSCRLSRLTISGNVMTSEKVLINDWADQFPSHSIGDLQFGPDGYLYASGGDGANYNAVDYGNYDNNPIGDPVNEGGALRSQDIRSTGDPTGLHGSVIRVDPDTGAAAPGNPYASSGDANARRIIAFGLRNPYRIAFRPGTSELYVADTGWNTYEELNRIPSVTETKAPNFGWPAYEGPYKQPGYAALDLPLLNSLYASGDATSPWFYYSHSQQVVPGSSEPTGGSSPTGIAFGGNTTYTDAYDGAMFFSDYARKEIYVMYPGPDGKPDPATRQIFAPLTAANGVVDLEIGPDGDLYYADLYQGQIERFVYTQPTQPTQPPVTGVGQLTGTVIGTTGSYNNDGFTRDKAFDGDFFSFFDAPTPDGAWTGLDFGAAKVVRKIAYAPRYDLPARAVGGKFQVSNDPTFASGVVTLYTVTSTPLPGVLTAVNINDAGTAYRYARFLGADGSAANIAEVGFYDTPDSNTGVGAGLQATYFNNVDLTGATATRVDSVINFLWQPDESPVTGIDPLTFSARWTGQVQAIEAGTYSLRVTADDGVRLWVDGHLLIDQWVDEAPTAYTASATFAAGDKKDIKLEYFQDQAGASVKLDWKRPGSTTYDTIPTSQLYSTGGAASGTPPTPVIATPITTKTWKVGDTISFSGSATDAEDGTLPASSLTWTLVLIHGNLIDPNNTHEHLIRMVSGVTSGTFVAPDHEYPSWLEIRLTAVDSSGQTTTVARRLTPQTGTITLASNVPGAALTFNDETVAAPNTQTYIIGASALISAPTSVVVNGQTLNFVGWSDGGSRSRTVIASAGSVTYTAKFAAALAAPQSLKATVLSTTRVGLSWVDAANAEAGYTIQRRLKGGSDSSWAPLGTVAANATAYTDAAAVAGTAYEYRVRAYSSSATGAYTAAVAAVTPLPTPTSLTASKITSSGVTLTWQDNAANETGYVVERRRTGGTFAVVKTLAANTKTFTDAGLSAATAYDYRVTATNAVSASTASSTVKITTPGTAVPLAPSSLTGVASSATAIVLKWKDNATNEAGYKVEGRVAGTSAWAVLATTGVNAATYTYTAAKTKTTYEFRVRAYYGSTFSSYSGTATAKTL